MPESGMLDDRTAHDLPGLPSDASQEVANMRGRATFVAVTLVAGTALAQSPEELQRRRADSAVRREYDRGSAQFRSDAARIGSSCEDIAELERIGATASDAPLPGLPAGWTGAHSVAEKYRWEVARRREAHAIALRQVIAAFKVDDDAWRAGLVAGEPIQPPPSTAHVRAAIESFRPCGADIASQAAKAVDDVEAQDKAAIADETKCRATPSCDAPRVAARAAAEAARAAAALAARTAQLSAAICTDLSEIRGARQEIARERSNPGGVVDLEHLHNMGEVVLWRTDDLKASKAEYAKLTHTPFNEASCTRGQGSAPR
jgi:hypothetical protein